MPSLVSLFYISHFLLTLTLSKFVFPSFSWDTTPVYIQICNQSGNFNATAIDIISRYSFIVIEKGQGENGSIPNYYAEDYMLQAAKSIKTVSPNTGVYFYWNSLLDWPQYYMHQILLNNSQWQMKNISNGTMYFHGDSSFPYHNHMLGFDLSQQSCADWWSTECYNMTKTGYFDGCFADRAKDNTLSNVSDSLEIRKQQIYYNRKFNTFIKIQKYLNETNKSVLFVNSNFGYKISGVMGMNIEQFTANEENILMLVRANFWRFNDSKSIGIIVHAGNHNPCNDPEQFVDLLAAFLIGVEEYCWFMCSSNNYFVDSNPLWYAEYDYSLGEPVSAAYKQNDTYYRQFSSGTFVMFDTSNNNGTIFWAKNFGYNVSNMPYIVHYLKNRTHTNGVSVLNLI